MSSDDTQINDWENDESIMDISMNNYMLDIVQFYDAFQNEEIRGDMSLLWGLLTSP